MKTTATAATQSNPITAAVSTHDAVTAVPATVSTVSEVITASTLQV
jgi:hypothetical protein